METVELAKRAIQEAFSRALRMDPEDFDRRDRQLAASLARVAAHFVDANALREACNAPLSPFSPCLPLALACHVFAGARGPDYPPPPDSARALLEMGADPFAASPPPPGEAEGPPGRFIFATDRLNAFEIALAKGDPGLLLALAPTMLPEMFQPQHWTAYKLFCDFPEPLRGRCDQALGSFAERGLLMSVIEPTEAAKGSGRKRL